MNAFPVNKPTMSKHRRERNALRLVMEKSINRTASFLIHQLLRKGTLHPCLSDTSTHIHHTRFTALCPGLPGWAGTRKVKPIWILMEQETVSGSGISWAICKSAPRSRQITTPAPHHSVFYRPDALPAAQPTASKHWRHSITHSIT